MLRLRDSHDPIGEAFEDLAFWAPNGDSYRLLHMLFNRYAKTIRAAQSLDTVFSRAIHLSRSRVPSEFVPALAILLGFQDERIWD